MVGFDSFANLIIDNYISNEELNSIINHMIESCDKTGSYFQRSESISIFVKHIKDFNRIYKAVQERAEQIVEEIIEEKEYKKQIDEDIVCRVLADLYDNLDIDKDTEMRQTTEDVKHIKELNSINKAVQERDEKKNKEKENKKLIFDDFFDWDWTDPLNIDKDTEISLNTEEMFTGILRKIESIAIERREDRINHRFKVGSHIDIDNYEHSEYGNLIEFHHDGGWGVADRKGVVLISNHLTTKASNCYPLFTPFISDYVTHQLYVSIDRDTELEGVISIDPLKELLPCKYKIESMEDYRDGSKVFAFRALSKKGFWGCYNDHGKKIAKFKYQTIEFNQGFIECGRDGTFHLQDHDSGDGGWDAIFDGHKDLYDLDGHLILGGYTEFQYLEDYNLYLFYFDTYKRPAPYDVGDFTIDKYYTCYEVAKCLILDKDFNLFLNEEKTNVKGRTIGSIEEISSTCIVNGKVLEIHDNHIVSDETEFKYIKDIDGLPCYETEVKKIITFFKSNGHVEWRKAVDDYYGWSNPELVLINQKIGFLKSTGLEMSTFDAISKEFDEHEKPYAAKIVSLSDEEAQEMGSNPNYLKDKGTVIQYYKISMQDAPKRIEDNWEIFNPNNVSWFPDDFLEKMGVYPDECEDDYDENDNGKSYGWSFEELEDAYWDALENDPSNEWNKD